MSNNLLLCIKCKKGLTTRTEDGEPVCGLCKTKPMEEKPIFESAPWNHPLNLDGWMLFRVGTCQGQWMATETAYQILSVVNDQPGNGHFKHTMEYFEASCRRDGKELQILEVANERLQKHLIKNGFTCFAGNHYKKTIK